MIRSVKRVATCAVAMTLLLSATSPEPAEGLFLKKLAARAKRAVAKVKGHVKKIAQRAKTAVAGAGGKVRKNLGERMFDLVQKMKRAKGRARAVLKRAAQALHEVMKAQRLRELAKIPRHLGKTIKATLRLFGRKAAKVSYSVYKGRAYYQRDIDLGPADQVEKRFGAQSSQNEKGAAASISTQAAIAGSSTRWPGCTIPYTVNEKMPSNLKTRIQDAIKALAKTGLKVIPRTNEKDYVEFVHSGKDGKCSSAVGRQGGWQTIKIPDWCKKISVAHEILHAFGMHHEQARPDRDKYVSIQWKNITDDDKHNYDINGEANGDYNHLSVMHYGAYSGYAKKKLLPVIWVKPKYWWAQFLIGNRWFISKGDKEAIKRMCSGG